MTRQKTLVRQHQIIEAARNLIAAKGMDGVTIDAIAEEVGLTEGAIYRHFASKHQILSLLVDDIERTLLDTVESAQTEGTSAVDSLEHILEAHLSDVEGHRAVSFVVIAEAMGFDGTTLAPKVSLMFTRYLELIQAVLDRGIREGSIRPDINANAAATTFFGLIQSTATLWALNGYAGQLAEFRSDMWDIYRKGVVSSD
jgi:AcrR family transcriptional regulator